MKKSKLYLILDAQVCCYEELFEIAKQSIKAGVDIFQLRDKHGSAKDMLSFSKKLKKLAENKALFIVNDRVDIALLSGADGVHVGQEDISVADARAILGRKVLIGTSCQTWQHLQIAQEQDVDYVGFGSVFNTLTKPDRIPMDLALLQKVVKSAKIPAFAIGGITRRNIGQLINIDCQRVAVCRSICKAKSVEKATLELKTLLNAKKDLRG